MNDDEELLIEDDDLDLLEGEQQLAGSQELYEHLRLEVDRGQVPLRIDKYLTEHTQHSSRNRIQQAADAGFLFVNDKPVKSNYKVRSGDVITLMLDRPHFDTTIEPEDIPLDVRYEDDDLMVIYKPAGMVVHPGCGNFHGTLVHAIAWHLRNLPTYDPNDPQVGLVHRIDKDTSGLLVICKTNLAHQSLAEQFAEHSINRIYSCIVYNHFDNDSSVVNKPIARAKNDRKKMAIDPDGRRAVTHIYLQENLKDNFAYVKCKLETGRTHQIRVHLTSINHPLLGDPVYGPKSCPYNLNGQVLHAGTLGFIHPRTNEYMEFTSDLPDYFTKLLNLLKPNQ